MDERLDEILDMLENLKCGLSQKKQQEVDNIMDELKICILDYLGFEDE